MSKPETLGHRIITYLICSGSLFAAGSASAGNEPQVCDCITFTSNATGNLEIYTIGLDGDNLRQITYNGARDLSPAFSPDGTKIAFCSNRDGTPAKPNNEIYIADAYGGRVKRLTTNDAAEIFPMWSPDGKKVVFISDRRGPAQWDLYITNADGTGEKRIIENRASNGPAPVFSPDGKKIAFYSEYESGGAIYTINVDGTDLNLVSDDCRAWGRPAFSPDGQKIAFVGFKGKKYDMYIVNIDGSDLTSLTHSGVTGFGGRFSPDGKTITFVTDVTTSSEIYTVNVDDKSLTRITHEPSGASLPAFSPDGRNIVFHSSPLGKPHGIYVAPPDGTGEPEFLIEGGNYYSPYPISFAPSVVNGRLLDYYGHWHEMEYQEKPEVRH